MKQKTKNKRIIQLLIVFSAAIVLGVLFLMMGDFNAVRTSLVKQYRGGSFQCVAYVQKYYKDAFGIEIQNVGMAQELYNKAPQYGLYAHRNGGITQPQPGDILVFGHRNKVGHVAIVTGVIKEGVLIVEQNWGSSGITTNGGKSLPMIAEDGSYTIPNRSDFYVIGWVSRTLKDPGNLFDFSSRSSEGWIVENDTRKDQSDLENVWAVDVVGKNPTLVSPVLEKGYDISGGGKIVFRARIMGSSSLEGGKIFLRNGEDVWQHEVPFSLKKTDDFQEIEVDLSSLGGEKAITQMKLMLNSSPAPLREKWELDWLRVAVAPSNEFPVE